MARSVDFPNAYQTIGLRHDSRDVALVCFVDPCANAPHKARILAQPCGCRRAPANWGRVVAFRQFTARRLFNLSAGEFVDDVYCAEPAQIPPGGIWAPKRLFQLLGPQHQIILTNVLPRSWFYSAHTSR